MSREADATTLSSPSALEPRPARLTCWGELPAFYADYHDTEWGVPVYDDDALFERLTLEGFQAGLSWEAILRKREGFREAFDGWDARRIAAYGPGDIARLMADARIVRNRLKCEGAVKNARAFLALQEAHGAFATFAWSFVGGRPLERPAPVAFADVPSVTAEAEALSKALKRAGMTFVGPTICYAFMQSVGMVNDHLAGCPARAAISG